MKNLVFVNPGTLRGLRGAVHHQENHRQFQKKTMRLLTVGSIHWKRTASMFAIDAKNRKLIFRRRCPSMDNSWAQIIAVVLCKKWKHYGAEVKGIGVGGALHVIGCQGDRSKNHKTTLFLCFVICLCIVLLLLINSCIQENHFVHFELPIHY